MVGRVGVSDVCGLEANLAKLCGSVHASRDIWGRMSDVNDSDRIDILATRQKVLYNGAADQTCFWC